MILVSQLRPLPGRPALSLADRRAADGDRRHRRQPPARDLSPTTIFTGISFHHLPVTRETKLEQESELWTLIRESRRELVVLARYMQVLSDELAAKLAGPLHQHPPLVPAGLQGRQALPPGASSAA